MSGTNFTAANQSDLAAALATILAEAAPLGARPAAYTITLTASFTIAGTLAVAIPGIGASVTIANQGHVIAGPGGLAVSGPGRVVLAGNNIFTGGIAFSSGTLELAAQGAAGSGAIIASGGVGSDQVLQIDGTLLPINRITATPQGFYSGNAATSYFRIDLPAIQTTLTSGTQDPASGLFALTAGPNGPALEANWAVNALTPIIGDGQGGMMIDAGTVFEPRHAVTVWGAGGGYFGMAFDDSLRNDTVQTAIADPLNAGIIAGVATPFLVNGPIVPAYPAGTIEAIMTTGAAVLLPDTTTALIDNAVGSASVIGGGADGQLVLAGTGGLIFLAGTGRGSVIAGGGNNAIFIEPGAGSQYVDLGAGNDTVVATGGIDTISAGRGHNAIWLGAAAASVIAEGDDTIIGAAGAATIDATKGIVPANVMAWLGTGGTVFNGGMGNSTIISASGADSISTAGGASQIWLGSQPESVSSAGADTIVAGSAADTVSVSGSAAIFGGAASLSVQGGNSTSVTPTVIAGAGNTTVNGYAEVFGGAGRLIYSAGYRAYGTIIGGSGPEVVTGAALMSAGTGNLVFTNPTAALLVTNPAGNATVNSGGQGSALLLYANGNTTYRGGDGGTGQGSYSLSAWGADTIIGQSGHLTIPLAVNALITGSPGGNNAITVGGACTVTGGGNGDVITLTNLAPTFYTPGYGYIEPTTFAMAGTGAETINAAAFNGLAGLTAGTGPDVLIAGIELTSLVAGSGADTLIGQGGGTQYYFTAGNANQDLIENFYLAQPQAIHLTGFPSGENIHALAHATTLNGSEVLTLSDGTVLTFQGVTGLTPENFA